MARTKSQEIVRRTPTATRESRSPELVVHADLESSRGYQALSSVAVGVLGRVGEAMADRRNDKFNEDVTKGSADRMQQDVTGSAPTPQEEMAKQTEGWRRGYMKADGALKLRDWQTETQKKLMQAEPGTDIEPMLKESMGELMSHPEFQDQHVRKALMPAIQRAADNVRQSWQKVEVSEIFARQQESLTEIAHQGIKDGSLLTDAGIEKLYKSLDTEDYAYLNRHDVDDIVAEAAKRAMASGEAAPQAVMDFLGRKLPGNGTSALNGKHGDELRVAAHAGEARIKQATDAARDQAMADAEFTLQNIADRGQMTNGHIDRYVDAFGLEGKAAQQFRRYWHNQQEQTLARWKAESEKRDKKAEIRQAMAEGRFFDLSASEISSFAHDEWMGAKTPDDKRNLMDKYAKIGVPIPQVKAMLDRATPQNAEWFKGATELYHTLREKDPQYAATYTTSQNAGLYEAHWRNVNVLGLSEEQSIRDLGTDKFKAEEAGKQIGMAWKDTVKKLPKLDNGVKRDGLRLDRIRIEAERIAAASPQITAQDAILAADQRISTQYTEVAGRTVLNLGMPKGAEKATEALLESVQTRMLGAGKLPKGTKLSAAVNPYDTSQWVVTNEKGVPVDDPDTERPIVFSPAQIASAHTAWTADHADMVARKGVAMNSANADLKKAGGGSFGSNYDAAVENTRSQLAVAQRNLKDYKPIEFSGDPERTRKTNASQLAARQLEVANWQKKWDALQPHTKSVTNVPNDFADYLKGAK